MQVGTRFEVGGERMVVREVGSGSMTFEPVDPSHHATYRVSGADMAAIVRAHVKRTRKSAQRVRA